MSPSRIYSVVCAAIQSRSDALRIHAYRMARRRFLKVHLDLCKLSCAQEACASCRKMQAGACNGARHASNLCARASMRRRTVSPFQTGRHVQQSCVFYGYVRFLPCSASTFSVFSVCAICIFIYQYDGVVQRKKYRLR
jgi:hypothetical protein